MLEIELAEKRLSASLKQSQNLELQSQLANERIHPLLHQINELRAQAEKHARIRHQIVDLVRSFDRIVGLHIEKLSKKGKARISVSPLAKELIEKNGNEARELQSKLRVGDINDLLQKKFVRVERGGFLYDSLSAVRRGLKSLVRYPVRLLLRLMGKRRRR